MCLKSVTKIFDKPLRGVTVAYKVFAVSPSGKSLYAPYMGGKVQRGKWLTADILALIGNDGTAYPGGFHCYTNRRAALKWAGRGREVFTVKVRNIVCKGMQWSINTAVTIVATQMFVPKPRKRKKS
jgi:hypothetical protein